VVVRDPEGIAHWAEVLLDLTAVEAIVAGRHWGVGGEHRLPGNIADGVVEGESVAIHPPPHRLERGEEATLTDAFRIWTCGDKRLIHFGLLLALSSAGWLLCSAALVHWILPASVHTPADFLRLVVLQPTLGLFEMWVLMSALIAAPMFASTVVTIPLLLEHPSLTLAQAVFTSWRVVAMNPFAMACWAGLLCLFTTLGIGSAFLGLLAIVPMLGHASWHAYRDLVTDDPSVP
jgi:uncharacterized membrane protein